MSNTQKIAVLEKQVELLTYKLQAERIDNAMLRAQSTRGEANINNLQVQCGQQQSEIIRIVHRLLEIESSVECQRLCAAYDATVKPAFVALAKAVENTKRDCSDDE